MSVSGIIIMLSLSPTWPCKTYSKFSDTHLQLLFLGCKEIAQKEGVVGRGGKHRHVLGLVKLGAKASGQCVLPAHRNRIPICKRPNVDFTSCQLDSRSCSKLLAIA